MLNDGGCPQGALQDDGVTKQASADVGGLYSSAVAHLVPHLEEQTRESGGAKKNLLMESGQRELFKMVRVLNRPLVMKYRGKLSLSNRCMSQNLKW